MIEIKIFELIMALILCVLLGVWGTLLWAELRHKIDTTLGRWSVLTLCWVFSWAYLIFG